MVSMQRRKIKVIQYGLGSMGREMVKFMLEKGLDIVGAIDIAEDKVGRDLGEVVGIRRQIGVKVSSDADLLFSKTEADIVLHATVSFLPEVWAQIIKAVEARMNVITIAEEMGYPYYKYPKLAAEIDEKAKKHGITILGTGINPGFAMDLMVLTLTGICHEVRKIKVTRLVDFSPFGKTIQRQIGAGLTIDEFNQGREKGYIPLHIGLPESLNMIADGLGWKLDKIKETAEPIIAEEIIETPNIKIEPGRVCGFNQRCYGIKNNEEVIILEELGRINPHLEAKNTISIEGIPNIIETMNVPPGNITTAAHVVNLIPLVIDAKPGLVTMKDLPIATCFNPQSATKSATLY